MSAVQTKPKSHMQRNGSSARSAAQGSGSANGYDTSAIETAGFAAQSPLSAFYSTGPALTLGAPGDGAARHNASRGTMMKAGGSSASGLQFKLAIGKAGDPFEREADAAADRVTSGGAVSDITPLGPGALSHTATLQRETAGEEEEPQSEEEVVQPCACEEEQQGSVEPPRVQRQTTEEAVQTLAVQRQEGDEEEQESEIVQPCENCDEERGKEVQRQDEGEDEPAKVQTASKGGAVTDGSSGDVGSILSHPGAGEPLAPSVKSRLEPGLRADLSDVRVHSDAAAHKTAHSLKARAFTHGKDIWLGSGESPNDQKLLAHEATHVIQQGHAGSTSTVQRRGTTLGLEAEQEHEQEQDVLAIQPKLQVNATRQFETAIETGASVDSGDQVAETEVPAKDESEPEDAVSVNEEKTDESTAEDGSDATIETNGGDATSSSGSESNTSSSTEPGTLTIDESERESPSENSVVQRQSSSTGSADGQSASGGGTEISRADAACAGGGVATCYTGEKEEPTEEPDQVPPNPTPTEVKAETDDTGEEDGPEPDNCPPVKAQIAQPAGAPPGPAPGAADGSSPGAGPGSPAPGATTKGPADPAAAAGGGPTAEGAAGETSESAAGGGSPMDATISLAESGHTTAVSAYENSSAALADTSQTIASLRRGTQFARGARGGSADELRRAAAARADRFFAGVADRLDGAVALAAGPIPDRLGGDAEAAKQELAASMESQKEIISQRLQQAKGQARSDANTAQRLVNGQTSAFEAAVKGKTTAAIDSLTKAHGEAAQQVTDLETTTLDRLNESYAKGRTDLEGLGTKIGAECITTGEEYAAEYRTFRNCTDDAWYDGNLSERRAIAQENVARSVASGYRDRIIESARKRAREVTKQGRTEDRCAVIASANQTRDSLDRQLSELKTALEGARDEAIRQANITRSALIASIKASLASTERQFDRQETEQRQLVDDTLYVQQLLQEQTSHAAAAAVQQGVRSAVSTTQSAVSTLQQQFAANQAPDPATLDETLSVVEERIETVLGGLDNSAEGGAGAARAQLKDALRKGLEALEGVTKSNDELATAASDGFSTSMRTIGRTDHFVQQRAGFTQQVEKSTSDGAAAFNKAVEGMREGCNTTITEAEKKLVRAGEELEKNLNQSKEGLECQITQKADEAASKEAPAWKKVLAVILVIIVIVIVIAVTIATAGGALAGLGFFATVAAGAAIGAAVGAVTSGLLAIAGNLWSNQEWSKGVLKAVAVGAITGAIGGAVGAGVGLGVGLVAKGASTAVQVAAQFGAAMVTAGGLDVVTQYVMGGFSFDNFSWKNLGLTLVITAITFGIGHRAGVRANARAGAGTPEPTTTAPEPTTTAPEPTPTAPEPTPTAPEPTPTAPEPTPAAPEPTPTAPEPTPTAPEPTPTAPEPTPTAPEPTPAAPEPTPAAPEPTPTAPEPTPAAPEPTPTAPEPTPAPKADTPEPPAPTGDAPEQSARPWEQGRNPQRYNRYVRNLQRRIAAGKTAPREPLGPEAWWNEHGSRRPNNPYGEKGTPAHQAKTNELIDLAATEFPPPRYAVVSEQPVPGLPRTRKPDAAVIDRQTGRVVKVFEAARFRKNGRFVRPDEGQKLADYDAAGIPYEFHPVGPNKPPGGVVRSPSATPEGNQ